MATFFIEQFGCRATQADAAAIERQLRDRGYLVSGDPNSADVVVVNTCTVTASADQQARQAIRKIHDENPTARIVVTGCYAQRAPEEIASLNGVTWVVGNSHKAEIPRLVEEMTPVATGGAFGGGFVPLVSFARGEPLGLAPGRPLASVACAEPFAHAPGAELSRAADTLSLQHCLAKILTGDILNQRELLVAPIEGGEAEHTRPVLKIQDGCDSMCSYCVIPQVRGRSRSLAPDRVIEEIRRLANRGAREVVLSGIDLGNYGRDLSPRTELGKVLRRILDETLIERLRVSSIEPMDVTGDLISLFAASDRLAPHFHMPMQSGSDRILAAMRRWYRAEHYARRVELVHEWIPDAAIGADVMVGFPGETDEDFCATRSLIEALPLTHLHVFSFSPRPGTAAENLPDHVSGEVVACRARELRALGEEKKRVFRATQAGRKMRVLTLNRTGEDASGPWTRALSGNYLDMCVAGLRPANLFLDIQVTAASNAKLLGVEV